MRQIDAGLGEAGTSGAYVKLADASQLDAIRSAPLCTIVNHTLRLRVAFSWETTGCKCVKSLAPQVGLEPTTLRLTALETVELKRAME
jgi:hypothetical protein